MIHAANTQSLQTNNLFKPFTLNLPVISKEFALVPEIHTSIFAIPSRRVCCSHLQEWNYSIVLLCDHNSGAPVLHYRCATVALAASTALFTPIARVGPRRAIRFCSLQMERWKLKGKFERAASSPEGRLSSRESDHQAEARSLPHTFSMIITTHNQSSSPRGERAP